MSGSGNYTLVHDEPAQWLVSSPSFGGFSWEDLEFVKLSERVNNSDDPADLDAAFPTHEIGHYLHLWHPFYHIKLEPGDANLTDQQKVDVLTQHVRGVLEGELAEGTSKEQVIQILDIDREVNILDTPPDDGGQLLYYMNRVANGGDGCGAIGEVKLNLKDGTPIIYTPDRSLVMSYYFRCLNFDQRFSCDQAGRMRNALINGNRRHLVAVQLGETAWPDEIVCATWNPNTDTQFYCWDLRPEDFQKKFDELHAEGMRLCSQQAYTRNGETRYGGIWNPGMQDEVVIRGWEVERFKDKTVELHSQNMRLIHMESYLLPDGQVRVNAIWNTGAHVQYWVQGWTKDDFTAKCSDMYSKGFRLVLLNGWNLPDGAVRYDAIWNLGSQGQHYIIDWTAEDFRNKYGEMWEQGFKLLVLDTHISDGGIRYDAVWDPDPAPQFVVWGKTREQVRAYYDEMWQQGMKLTSMSALRL